VLSVFFIFKVAVYVSSEVRFPIHPDWINALDYNYTYFHLMTTRPYYPEIETTFFHSTQLITDHSAQWEQMQCTCITMCKQSRFTEHARNTENALVYRHGSVKKP
jgi:hypothetical protein